MNTVPYDKNWLKNNFRLIQQKKLDGVFGRTIYLVSISGKRYSRFNLWSKIFENNSRFNF